MSKFKWLERRARKKREKQERKRHSMAEPSYQIVHRLPTVGDTTVSYNYDDILCFYNDVDSYIIEKIESGIRIDEKTGNFLKQDLEVRCMMFKALLVEWRERHRNARISINEEKKVYKEQLELELKEMQKKYDRLCEQEEGQ